MDIPRIEKRFKNLILNEVKNYVRIMVSILQTNKFFFCITSQNILEKSSKLVILGNLGKSGHTHLK